MKKFVVNFNGGDSYVIEAKSSREAARIARKQGKDLMKYNNHSSMYWIWDEEEETLLYSVHTFKVGNKTVTKISNCLKETK